MPKVSAKVIQTVQHYCRTERVAPPFVISRVDEMTIAKWMIARPEWARKYSQGLPRSRRVDLFANGVIANTLRWLIASPQTIMHKTFADADDLDRRPRALQKDFSKKWHEYSWATGKRTARESRSSFSNNILPYARLHGAVCAQRWYRDGASFGYDREGIAGMLGVSPQYTSSVMWRDDAMNRGVAPVRIAYRCHMVWAACTPATWIATLTDRELDVAFQTMESRLTDPTHDLEEHALAKSYVALLVDENTRRNTATEVAA